MNNLEKLIIEYCAAAKHLIDLQNSGRERFSAADFKNCILNEDSLREKLAQIESEIDSEFAFAIKTAKDWGQISGLPDMVLDICVRSAEIDWCPSRGFSIRNPIHPLLRFQKLVTEALVAAQRLSTSDVAGRKVLKDRLQTIYLSLGDLVAEEWAKARRREL